MSLRELLPTLRAWEAEGAQVGRATLIRAYHSSPRTPGAVMLATDDERLDGSVSGGCVEGAAAGEIRRAQRDGNVRVIRYGISDETAWDVGLACGGIIDVLVEPSGPARGDRRRRSRCRRPADSPPGGCARRRAHARRARARASRPARRSS